MPGRHWLPKQHPPQFVELHVGISHEPPGPAFGTQASINDAQF
jgi:hypothetical protein